MIFRSNFSEISVFCHTSFFLVLAVEPKKKIFLANCGTVILFIGPSADFLKKVPGVFTHSMETIYLSMSAHVAEGTFFQEIPGMSGVYNEKKLNFCVFRRFIIYIE